MSDPKVFIDTNILIYLLSADDTKADQAELILRSGGIISVQVLNEIANTALHKLAMPWVEISEFLSLIRKKCLVKPLNIGAHDKGRFIAERYGFSVYDAMIVATALLAGCDTLYSEDMQCGQRIEKQLRICNPFVI